MATINSGSGGGMSLYLFNYSNFEEVATVGRKDFTITALGSNKFQITKTTAADIINIRIYGKNGQ